jgi:DNA-binding beta-propeller fold protein YncE
MSDSSGAPSRRKFLKLAGAGAFAAAAFGVGYASQIPAIQDILRKERQAGSQVASLQSQLRQLQISSGVVGYTFGKGFVAAVDLSQQRLISTSVISSFADTSLSFAHSRLDALNRAWGGNSKTGQVFVIDPVRASVVGTVQLPGRWAIMLMDMDPQGKFVYVLNLLVAPNASDADLAMTKVNVADIAPSILYKIDTPTLDVVGSLQVARFACDTSFSPEGRYFYLPNQLDKLVTVVDLNTFTVVDEIPGTIPGPQLGGSMITVSPSGKWVFLENSPSHNWSGVDIRGENSEIIIDAQARKVVKILPFDEPPGVDEFSPDGRYATVTLRSKVAVIDTNTLEVVATPAVKGPGRPAYSPDSSFVYVPSSGDKAIQVIDLNTFSVTKTIALRDAVSVIIPFDPKGVLGFKLYPTK